MNYTHTRYIYMFYIFIGILFMYKCNIYIICFISLKNICVYNYCANIITFIATNIVFSCNR